MKGSYYRKTNVMFYETNSTFEIPVSSYILNISLSAAENYLF